MASSLADAKAQLSRLSIPAKGSGQGDPRISPWATIEVRGTGSTTDGFWIVKSATHTIHYDGRYRTDFTVVTDGTGSNQPSATRPSTVGNSPVINLQNSINTIKVKKSKPKLTAPSIMVSQQNAGYKTLPRRWR